MEKRICQHCRIEKEVKSFNANKNKKGGFYYAKNCNTCRSRLKNLKKHGKEDLRNNPFSFCEQTQRWFKICSKCKEKKPFEEFAKDNGKPTAACLECRQKAARHWLENMTDEGRKAYYHHRNTSDATRSYRRKPELRLKSNTMPENWQRFLDRTRSNRTKRRMTRRAREKTAVVIPFTKQEIIKRDGCKCYLCDKELKENQATIDHVLPLARGGFHCPSNAKIACDWCNKSKGKKTLAEYLQYKQKGN